MSDDGRAPIDPDFVGLFRDDDPPPPAPVPAAPDAADPDAAAPIAPEDPSPPREPAPDRESEPVLDPPLDPVPDPDPAPAAAATADPVADTGRLFRSQGADSHREAVLAIPADRVGRLRTLGRDDTAVAPAATTRAPQADVEAAAAGSAAALDRTSVERATPPAPVPGSVPVGVMPNDAAAYPPDPTNEEALTAARSSRSPRRTGEHRARSISAGAAYVIVIGVTFVVGLVNAMLGSGDIGWPTGLALLVSSAYVALTIRPDDAAVAVIVPPVAFAFTALTAGQFFLGSSANSLLNRGVVWFFDLADSWPWIIGSTALALVIVLVRRYRR